MPDFVGLMASAPTAFGDAGDALKTTAGELDGAGGGFHQAVEEVGTRWSGAARAAQDARASALLDDVSRTAGSLRQAGLAASEGGTALQSVVAELRATVQGAFDAGFIVLMPAGVVQPGPELEAAAAALGPAAPAAEAAYESTAAVLTGDIDALVVEANTIDAQVAAQIQAAFETGGVGRPATLFARPGEKFTGSGPPVGMNMDNVRSVAAKYNIDIRGVTFKIDKSLDGIRGITRPNGTVVLARGAFRNEQVLARTLVHELFHVGQLASGMKYPSTLKEADAYEVPAYAHEEAWWNSL